MACFPPSNFAKDAFWKGGSVLAIFENFFNNNFSPISAQKLLFKMKEDIDLLWYAFYSKLSTFSGTKKSCFFFENIIFFVKNQISYLLRNFFISVAVYGKLAIIW